MAYTRRQTQDGVTVMNKALYDNLQDGIEQFGMTPQMFGAIGDGVHDDTESIQKALDNSDCVFFPTGSYLIDSNSINIDGKHLMFDNGAKIIIGTCETYKNDIIVISGSTIIENLYLETVVNCKANHLLSFVNTKDCVLSNAIINIQESVDSSITPIDLNNNNKNVLIDNLTLYQYSNGSKGGIWVRNSTSGISENITFRNCKIYKKNGDEVIAIWGWKGTVRNITIENCYFKVLQGNTIILHMFTVGQDGITENVVYRDCIFDFDYLYQTIMISVLTNGGTVKGVSFDNCKFNIGEDINPLFVKEMIYSEGDNFIFTNCDFTYLGNVKSEKTFSAKCDFFNCRFNNMIFGSCITKCNIVNGCYIDGKDTVVFGRCKKILDNEVSLIVSNNKSIIIFDEVDSLYSYMYRNNIKVRFISEGTWAQLRMQFSNNTHKLFLGENDFSGVSIYITGIDTFISIGDNFENTNNRWNIETNKKIINSFKEGELIS